MASYNISFIGAGSVAEALCRGLAAGGHKILSVSSKGGTSAAELAESSGASWIKDYTIPENCDLVIVAVTDTAITDVADKIRLPGKTVLVHTAGSVGMSALGRTRHCGVLYPLQTFTKGFSPDMREVPFFIEGTEKSTLTMLQELVESMGANASECDSDRRKYLHLAAVFTNNFANFMMTAGGTIATQAGFDPAVLRPLIEETARKALRAGPPAAQTGPAVRRDAGTMNNHIELLSFSPEYSELYIRISGLIMDYYKKTTV